MEEEDWGNQGEDGEMSYRRNKCHMKMKEGN
jgi:hypothetical protein